MEQLSFLRIGKHDLPAPERAMPGDAGFDLRANTGNPFWLEPGNSTYFGCGFGFVIPVGLYGRVLGRSSIGKQGIIIPGGVIDQGYTGEITIVMYNIGVQAFLINPGDRVAQIVFTPYYTGTIKEATITPITQRGSNGFGSSGKK